MELSPLELLLPVQLEELLRCRLVLEAPAAVAAVVAGQCLARLQFADHYS